MKSADAACVVLASGLSQRFGETDKLMAELCGKPVLEHVLETVTFAGFGESFLVSQAKTQPGFSSVINTAPESGQGHALRLGIEAARDSGWDSIAIVLGDMPLITVSHLEMLIKELGAAQSVVSVFQGQMMPPAMFKGEAISLILADNSTIGARHLFRRLEPVCVTLKKEEATPVDLITVASIMEARKI